MCTAYPSSVAVDMQQQEEFSSPTAGLFDLPEACLHHIVSFMDMQTKLQFFISSKGSMDEPGCAVLVLKASKLHCTHHRHPDVSPRPEFCSLLHWASRISTHMELKVVGWTCHDFQLLGALHNPLLYPDARVTLTDYVPGSPVRPVTYPGITSLELSDYTSPSLIPGLVADAFPNLKCFTATTWKPDASRFLRPVLQRGLSRVEHVKFRFKTYYERNELEPATATAHVAQQLCHMPSLTSIDVDNRVFRAIPAAVLAKLKKLKLEALDRDRGYTLDKGRYIDRNVIINLGEAALKACSQLESLQLDSDYTGIWSRSVSLHVPSLRVLDVGEKLDKDNVALLLAMPHLTTLTAYSLYWLPRDYSSAPCSWKQLTFKHRCSNNITKLPLHTLDHPIECRYFMLFLSDYAADLAAIRAAKPHLLRCGGIKMSDDSWSDQFHIEYSNNGIDITKEEMTELLGEWAPCLSTPELITYYDDQLKPYLDDAVAQLWPVAELREWESGDWQPCDAEFEPCTCYECRMYGPTR